MNRIQVNNQAVDAAWRALIGQGFSAEKTANYGDNQIYFSEKSGLLRYSLKVVGTMYSFDRPAGFLVPKNKNFDFLAAVLLSPGGSSALDVRFIPCEKLTCQGYSFARSRWGSFRENSVGVNLLNDLLKDRLPSLAKQLLSRTPTTKEGREARVEKVLGNPQALMQQEIVFG